MTCFQVHSGHRHGEAQRNPQQVQGHAAGVRLPEQGAQGSGEETRAAQLHCAFILEGNKADLSDHFLFFCLLPADEDHGEGERHLQRGEADVGGRALAGLSAAGVLQPGVFPPLADQ